MAEPSPKKVKMSDDDEDLMEEKDVKRIQAQLKSESGEIAGAPFDLPIDITAKKLQLIVNAVLQKVCKNLAYCTVWLKIYSKTFYFGVMITSLS